MPRQPCPPSTTTQMSSGLTTKCSHNVEKCYFCGSASASGHFRRVFPNQAVLCGNNISMFQDIFATDLKEAFTSDRSAKYCNACFRAAKHVCDVRKKVNSEVVNITDISGIYEFKTPVQTEKRPLETPSPSSTRRPSKRQLTSTPVKSEHSYVRALSFQEDSAIILSSSNPLNITPINTSNSKIAELNKSFAKCDSVDSVINVVWNCEELQNAIKKRILLDIDSVCSLMCSVGVEPGPSLLRTSGDPEALMTSHLFPEIIVEMERTNPFLLSVLRTVCTPLHLLRPNTESTIAMMYSMAMHCRNTQLSAVQRLNTCAFLANGAHNDLLRVMNKSNITLSKDTKIEFLTELGGYSTGGIVKSLVAGKNGKITVDNIDGKISANEIRIVGGSKEFHYTASTYLPERGNFDHLPDGPREVTEDVDVSLFYLSDAEEKVLKDSYKVHIARILVKYCPAFAWMKPCVADHIPHDYADLMAQKSEVHPMQITLHDPKYLQNCVSIMDEVLGILGGCYRDAGLGEELDRATIPLGGDQLVRVRMEGAKALRRHSHTRTERLEVFNPVIIEFFHTIQDFLEKLFKTLYDDQSMRVPGSLAYYRNQLRRTNVNGQVKGKYQGHLDFLITVTETLIVHLAMKIFGMENIESRPNAVPENISHMNIANRKPYMDQITSQVLNAFHKAFVKDEPEETIRFEVNVNGRQFNLEVPRALVEERETSIRIPGTNLVVQLPAIPRQIPPNDDLLNYSNNLLQWGIHVIEFLDMVKEGDVHRANVDLKRMLPFFYSWSVRSNYFKEIVDYIMKTEVLLSEQLAERVRCASFVNPKGGAGNNKSADMQQENTICNTKRVLKTLGAGKSDKGIIRASAAAPVVTDITKHYEDMLQLHVSHDRSHSHKDRAPDVAHLLPVISHLQPFAEQDGRQMRKFIGVSSSPFDKVNKERMNELLQKLVARCRRGLDLVEEEGE